MAWFTPLAGVSTATLTAAQWNASVRDNLLETAPAKATSAEPDNLAIQLQAGGGQRIGATRRLMVIPM